MTPSTASSGRLVSAPTRRPPALINSTCLSTPSRKTRSDLCRAGGEPQAWSAQATVSWGAGSPTANVAAGDFVQQATIVPALHPTEAAADGEIAVPIELVSGGLLTGPAIAVSLSGACTGSSCPSPVPPGPPYASGAVTTTSGCAVFTNLYSGLGWTYTATITDSGGYVDPSERSTGPGAPSSPTLESLTATAGTVSVPPGDAGFQLAQADPYEVTFQMTNFAGTSGKLSGAPTTLPITVTSTSQGLLDCGSDGCTLGDGSSSFNGQQSALLYPLSNYEGWAGGWWADPSPAVYCPGSPPQTCAAQPTSFNAAAPPVSFPVYPVALKITAPPGIAGSVQLTATPVLATSTNLALAPAIVGATSTTGLPLGQYQITASPALARWRCCSSPVFRHRFGAGPRRRWKEFTPSTGRGRRETLERAGGTIR